MKTILQSAGGTASGGPNRTRGACPSGAAELMKTIFNRAGAVRPVFPLQAGIGRPVLLFLAMATAVFAGDPAPVDLPFYVYRDFGVPVNHGSPSGWIGDYRDLRIEMDHRTNVFAGTSCMSFTYTAEGSRYTEMAGMQWQNPANNSGDIDGGVNLSHATKLTFWARGEKGGEYISEFCVGGTLGAYPDTDKAILQDIRLEADWTQYEIDLTKSDLSYISCFFGWVANRYHNRDGFKFYIDEVKFE